MARWHGKGRTLMLIWTAEHIIAIRELATRRYKGNLNAAMRSLMRLGAASVRRSGLLPIECGILAVKPKISECRRIKRANPKKPIIAQFDDLSTKS